MVLTLRPDQHQEKLINKLKEMYFKKTATEAVFKAIRYVAEEYENNRIKIAELETKVETFRSREKEVKFSLRQIRQIFSSLSDYAESK